MFQSIGAGLFQNKRRLINIAVIIVILALLTALPYWASPYVVFFLMTVFSYTVLGQTWNLLSGFAGLVSLGNQVFIALGGYSLAILSNKFGVPLIPAVLLGSLVSAVLAAAMCFTFLRMKGMYFAIATWITAEAFMAIFSGWKYVGTGFGLFVFAARPLTNTALYYCNLVLVVCVIAVVCFLLRSKPGLGLLAMKGDDVSAETSGVSIFKTRLLCMLVNGYITSLAGGVIYFSQIWVEPYSSFNISWTVASMFVVVIGGIGTVAGPIVGALVYVFLNQYLARLGGISMVMLGAIAVIVILFAPKGIIGTLQEKFNFEIFSLRRRSE